MLVRFVILPETCFRDGFILLAGDQISDLSEVLLGKNGEWLNFWAKIEL
jgi:hypothetical protein